MSEPLVTLPLFEVGPPVPRAQVQRAQRPAGWTGCPSCISHDRVALIRSGEHLLYREHTYRTYSGGRMTCPASLVALCTLPPKPVDRATASRCPHEGPL